MAVRLKFHGAARTVTGSCYLVEHPGGRFLVDCGLFQGSKTIRELNYGGFPFDPNVIDFVILTHAHIDHSGLIPKLSRHGFTGPVFTTEGTADLLTFMWPDSGYIQEVEVERLNRRNASRGLPSVQPIYTKLDAEKTLDQIRPLSMNGWCELAEGVRVRFWNAGHILGAVSLELEVATDGRGAAPFRIVFSGDIGPEGKAFHPDPEGPGGTDFLIVESTYGSREREERSPVARRTILLREVRKALKAGGNLVIPVFAVERTQELLHDLGVLLERKELPPTPVFLDSPLASNATEVFERHADSLEDVNNTRYGFRNPNFRFIESVEESKALNKVTSGAIIMAASGMCDAGRIRFHLENNLWRQQATILLVGYQAPGTIGYLLKKGASSLRLFGREVAVRARVASIDVYSAHADRSGLIDWVRERQPVRRGIFLTHGEPDAMIALRQGLTGIGVDEAKIHIPELDEVFKLSHRGTLRHSVERPRLAERDVAGEDWHNEYAALLLDLARRLRRENNVAGKKTVIQAIRDILNGGEPSGDKNKRRK